MFNVVERHQKLVKGIMITITATFVVWGISGYLGMVGDDGYVAKVGSNKIYSKDIDQLIDQNPDQSHDKMQVLFGLISRQLLFNSFQDNHLTVTTAQLQDAIAALPLFQTNGQFDRAKYQQFLTQRYTSSAKFEQDVKQQLLIQQTVDLFKNSYFTAQTFESKYAALLSRQRNVAKYIITPQQFYTKVNVSESDIKNYYQQNIAKYTLPQQVKLQYLVLSNDQLIAKQQVSAEEVKQYLVNHPAASSTEQVDVSHILLTVPTGASPSQKAQIKVRAEQILAKIKANPTKFAELAKQFSQDPGSASQGGDLGYFGKGVMVPAFEKVAFSLKPGQISGIVETQFGFHILKMNAVKGNDPKAAYQAALKQLQKQKAGQQLASLSEQLTDLTYNQADSLQPAASKLDLTLQNSDWIAQGATQDMFANPKLQKAIFTDDVIKQHHNSEVVDMGDGRLVVARVTAYQPAQVKPLASVMSTIKTSLTQHLASQLAASYGQSELTQIQQGKVKLKFSKPENVTLLGQSATIDPQAVRQIFALPQQFPAYTGAIDKDGNYVIYQVLSQSADSKFDQQNQRIVSQMQDQYAMFTLNAYISALRSQYKVSYKLDRVQANGAAPTAAANQ